MAQTLPTTALFHKRSQLVFLGHKHPQMPRKTGIVPEDSDPQIDLPGYAPQVPHIAIKDPSEAAVDAPPRRSCCEVRVIAAFPRKTKSTPSAKL